MACEAKKQKRHARFRLTDIAGSVIESSSEDRKITISIVDSEREKRRVMVLCPGDDQSFSAWSMWLSRASKSVLELHYCMDRLINKGAFARVVLGKDIHTEEPVAIKLIEKSNAPPSERKYFEREVKIMQALEHKNIVSCFDVFDSRLRTRIVMEYMEGGTLGDLINRYQQAKTLIPQELAKSMMHEILTGVEYLHANGTVHRDLKPDNCLLSSNEAPHGPVKIADFGLASMLDQTKQKVMGTGNYGGVNEQVSEKEREAVLSSAVGSSAFVAPEIFDLRYGTPVDMWSCGVILYMMLSGGVMPFRGKSQSEMISLARNGHMDLSSKTLPHASASAINLLKGLLNPDGKRRLTARQALAHPWLQDMESSSASSKLSSEAN